MIFDDVVRDMGDPREIRTHVLTYNEYGEMFMVFVPSASESCPPWREISPHVPLFCTSMEYLGRRD